MLKTPCALHTSILIPYACHVSGMAGSILILINHVLVENTFARG